MYLPTRETINQAHKHRSTLTFEMMGLKAFTVHADGTVELLNPGIDKQDALAALLAFTNMAITKAQSDSATKN
jgi:hypothetical protein